MAARAGAAGFLLWTVAAAALLGGCVDDAAPAPLAPDAAPAEGEAAATAPPGVGNASLVELLPFNGTVVAASTMFGQPGPGAESARAIEGSVGRAFSLPESVVEMTIYVNETGGPSAGTLSIAARHDVSGDHSPAFDGFRTSRSLTIPDPAVGDWMVTVRAFGAAVLVEYEGLVVLVHEE